jgi:hypothetical protein
MEKELLSDVYTTVDPSSETIFFFFRFYDRTTDTLLCETDPLLILPRPGSILPPAIVVYCCSYISINELILPRNKH